MAANVNVFVEADVNDGVELALDIVSDDLNTLSVIFALFPLPTLLFSVAMTASGTDTTKYITLATIERINVDLRFAVAIIIRLLATAGCFVLTTEQWRQRQHNKDGYTLAIVIYIERQQ